MHRNKAHDAGTLTACVSKRSFGHGGFTLVEVLAAVVLLSVGLLAVLSAGQAGRETQQRAVYMAAGRLLAQTKVDEARAISFASINHMAGTGTDSSLPPGNSITVAVSQYTNSSGQPDPDLKRVLVTVAWPEAKGSRSVVYETLIANKN